MVAINLIEVEKATLSFRPPAGGRNDSKSIYFIFLDPVSGRPSAGFRAFGGMTVFLKFYSYMRNMAKISHFFVWFLPFMVFAMLEYLFFFYSQNPAIIFWFIIFSAIIVSFGIMVIIGERNPRSFFLFLATPLFLVLGQFIFVLFLEGKLLRHIIAIIPTMILGIFLENTYVHFQKKEKYEQHSMGNILSFLSLIILYLFAASLFGFIVYLNVSLWIATFIIMFVAFIVTEQVMYFHEVSFQKSWPYLVITSLVAGEFFWVINFLPSSLYVNAFILTVLYYLMIGVSRNHLLGILNRSVFLRYFFISIFSLLVVLITAKWS